MSAARDATWLVLGVALAGLALGGCPRRESKGGAQGSASAAPSASMLVLPAPVASGFPMPDVVSKIVNPNAEAAHVGPRGRVVGRVVATGDPAPDQPDVVKKIPPECSGGREAYGKLFREGPGRALADAIVAVTGYKGYVPESEPTVNATAKDCFWGTRTFAVTFGQRIDIVSGDGQAYIPELLGEHGQPQLIATPGGKAASHLYPTRPGRYQIVDNLKLFMTAEVIVLKYSTHAVTGLDGRFEIPNVPAGPVTVWVSLPQTQATSTREVVVQADRATDELVIELPFSAAEFAKAKSAAAAASASASSQARAAAPASAPAPRASAPLRPPQKSAPPAETTR
jgi:hypothetical protein